MSKQVTLQDMIKWAKDRCLDDLLDFLKNEGSNYHRLSTEQLQMLHNMTMLLSLPDDKPETLAALSVSYWNGEYDTFWEVHEEPRGFVGFCNTSDME